MSNKNLSELKKEREKLLQIKAFLTKINEKVEKEIENPDKLLENLEQ